MSKRLKPSRTGAPSDRNLAVLRFEQLESRQLLATLPTGFAESAIATGLNSATAMEVAPNGDLWVLEQGGQVKRFVAGSTTADGVGSVSGLGLSSSGERGLLGIAFDPQYAANKQVYLYYTATSGGAHNRISRFTVNDTSAADYYFAGASTVGADDGSSGTPTQSVIFELDALSSATNHNGGAIHFGPDGKLYVAVGDNANGSNAQSLTNVLGKMLRINSDGTIPSNNPFYASATGNARSIWAVGLRNPYTFTFQTGTGTMFINDVGQNTWEEINQGAAGANYGWPGIEGNQGTTPTSPGTYRAPLYTYNHGSGGFQGYAITGGAFYNPSTQQFPASYAGDYFFADYVNDWINVIDVGTKQVSQFATAAPGAVDLRVAADGSLLYLARDANAVYRVQYTANVTATITQDPVAATVSQGQTATLTVAASGAAPLSYQWQKLVSGTWTNVANGGRVSGATSANLTINATVAADAGQYRAIVSNAAGSDTSAAAMLTISPNQAPTVAITIDSGLSGGKFIAGQEIAFSGSAADPEDGTLGGGSLTWRIDYITSIGSGNPVVRPFIADFTNTTSSRFTPATTGPYTLSDVAYRVTLTARDSQGVAKTTSVDILPNVAIVTLATSPSGLQVTVDGQPFAAPHTFTGVVGFERPIDAAAKQTSGGVSYRLQKWSDGQRGAHTIVTPFSNTTFTADYFALNPAAAWQNQADNLDVVSDGSIVPLDALVVINELNGRGPRQLVTGSEDPVSSYFDVNGDNFVTPLDALIVINWLNSSRTTQFAATASEPSTAADSSDLAAVEQPLLFDLLAEDATVRRRRSN